MSSPYFSDQERGPRPRVKEEIEIDAWGGILILIQNLVRTDAFAAEFADKCPDRGISGTDRRAMAFAIRAEIPELDWPEDMNYLTYRVDPATKPSTLAILDLVQFCHLKVAKPIQEDYHPFFGHHHLRFDPAEGRQDFRDSIERIFARNELAYELRENGQIVRLAPPVLREALRSATFQTGDPHLDNLLEAARTKYLDPAPLIRRESLEKLWDAWERLKTLQDPSDKKKSIGILLDRVSAEPKFRARLETEARELTEIGNNFMIRHTEVGKTAIADSQQVDYLFQRLFGLIYLLLRSL
ncbi:MAG: hypothetical protein AABN34_26930 [Acidobacteriota bacterium]